MEFIERERLSAQEWSALGADEPGAWGGGAPEGLVWLEKTDHGALLGEDGSVVATASTALCKVAVEGAGEFEVLGVGSVFVLASQRHKGLVARVLEPMLRPTPGGPERAMLFCHQHLAKLYGKLGFVEIEAPVWAEQPSGRIEIPMRAMWLALDPDASWPPGRVDVDGLPF